MAAARPTEGWEFAEKPSFAATIAPLTRFDRDSFRENAVVCQRPHYHLFASLELMDSKIQELVITLEELARLLESDGAHHWSLWMRTAARRLSDGDGSGVEYLLRAYGGMGSINDLVLGQTSRDGNFAWKPGYISLNERFESLRAKAWQLAQDIKRSSGGA